MSEVSKSQNNENISDNTINKNPIIISDQSNKVNQGNSNSKSSYKLNEIIPTKNSKNLRSDNVKKTNPPTTKSNNPPKTQIPPPTYPTIQLPTSNNNNNKIAITNTSALPVYIIKIYENTKPHPQYPVVGTYNIDTHYKRAIVFIAYRRCAIFEKVFESYKSLPLYPYYDIIISIETNRNKTISCMKNYVNKLINENNNNNNNKFITLILQHNYTYYSKRKLRTGPPRITHHYYYLLYTLFNSYNYDYLYIAEDDIKATDDTLDYLMQTEYLLREDKSLFCINTFNRQAKQGLVQSSKRLFRTDMNVGWGWLIGRDKGMDLVKKWPLQNKLYIWDNWVLMYMDIMDYECISPEIPRSIHIGKKGTTMNRKTYEKEAVRVFSEEKNGFDFGDLSYLLKDNYEEYMMSLFTNGKIINYNDLDLNRFGNEKTYILPYYLSDYPTINKVIQTSHIPRDKHKGTYVFYGKDWKLIIAERSLSPYLPEKQKFRLKNNTKLIVGNKGDDCDRTCNNYRKEKVRYKCDVLSLIAISRPHIVGKYLDCPCYFYEASFTSPSLLGDNSGTGGDGCCLIGNDANFKCDGKHKASTRLCPCLPI